MAAPCTPPVAHGARPSAFPPLHPPKSHITGKHVGMVRLGLSYDDQGDTNDDGGADCTDSREPICAAGRPAGRPDGPDAYNGTRACRAAQPGEELCRHGDQRGQPHLSAAITSAGTGALTRNAQAPLRGSNAWLPAERGCCWLQLVAAGSVRAGANACIPTESSDCDGTADGRRRQARASTADSTMHPASGQLQALWPADRTGEEARGRWR